MWRSMHWTFPRTYELCEQLSTNLAGCFGLIMLIGHDLCPSLKIVDVSQDNPRRSKLAEKLMNYSKVYLARAATALSINTVLRSACGAGFPMVSPLFTAMPLSAPGSQFRS